LAVVGRRSPRKTSTMIEEFEPSQTSPYATVPPNRVAG